MEFQGLILYGLVGLESGSLISIMKLTLATAKEKFINTTVHIHHLERKMTIT